MTHVAPAARASLTRPIVTRAVLAEPPAACLSWPHVCRMKASIELRNMHHTTGRRDRGAFLLGALVVVLPLMGAYRAALFPMGSGMTAASFAATCALLPTAAYAATATAMNSRSAGRWWALGVITGATVAGVAVFGPDWLIWANVVAVLVLVVAPPPWSFLLHAALVIAVISFVLWRGFSIRWAWYLALSLVLLPVALALLLALAAKVRELRDAQQVLADAAVAHERSTADRDLHRTLGTALENIARIADGTRHLIRTDPDLAARRLEVMVDGARQAVAEARRTVRRYRQSTVGIEVQTAARLLMAVGISTEVTGQLDGLDSEATSEFRADLQREVAGLLRRAAPGRCVIAVRQDAGPLRLEVRYTANAVSTKPGADR
jgi:two-component system sensor histidine kinase DesK